VRLSLSYRVDNEFGLYKIIDTDSHWFRETPMVSNKLRVLLPGSDHIVRYRMEHLTIDFGLLPTSQHAE